MSNSLISVIVPVYKVEKYLHKCVDSILAQTYTNLEIILVDDGSPDNCGRICDEYAAKDSRIKVIHQENGGQSVARNNGVTCAEGEYVSFIDSDDYIEPTYIESLYSGIEKYNSAISACRMYCESEDGKIFNKNSGSGVIINYSKIEALKEICYEEKLGSSPCCKLFKTELVRNIPFPEGKKYEDLATIYKLISSSEAVSFIDEALYHYVQHNGSTMRSGWRPYNWDLMEAAENMYAFYLENYPALSVDITNRFFFSANEFFVLAEKNDEFLNMVFPIRQKLKPMWETVARNPRVSFVKKIKYFLLLYFPRMHKLVYDVYNLKIKKL